MGEHSTLMAPASSPTPCSTPSPKPTSEGKLLPLTTWDDELTLAGRHPMGRKTYQSVPPGSRQPSLAGVPVCPAQSASRPLDPHPTGIHRGSYEQCCNQPQLYTQCSLSKRHGGFGLHTKHPFDDPCALLRVFPKRTRYAATFSRTALRFCQLSTHTQWNAIHSKFSEIPHPANINLPFLSGGNLLLIHHYYTAALEALLWVLYLVAAGVSDYPLLVTTIEVAPCAPTVTTTH